MTERAKPRPTPVAAYVYLLPPIIEIARDHGYAIAVHGSMVRDMDLVACPWTDDAVEPEKLLTAIIARIGFAIDEEQRVHGPTPHPHGRVSYAIVLDGGPYIDLSVMPRSATKPRPEQLDLLE